MTTITENSTVGEVASSFPASIPVFQQFGIDFCCGGNKTLADVCRDKGLSVDGLIAGVALAQQPAASTGNREWSSATLSELIDHILAKHHAYLRSEMCTHKPGHQCSVRDYDHRHLGHGAEHHRL